MFFTAVNALTFAEISSESAAQAPLDHLGDAAGFHRGRRGAGRWRRGGDNAERRRAGSERISTPPSLRSQH
jgi:hypothetical protein